MAKLNSTQVNVAHLANLSRLPVSPQEAKKLAHQFADTLKVVSQLNQLNTSNISSTFQVTGLSNVTRKDKVDTKRMFSQKQALKNAPSTHKGYFVVPAVLSHET